MKKEVVETVLEISTAVPCDDGGQIGQKQSHRKQAAVKVQDIWGLVTKETQEQRSLNGIVIGRLVDYDEAGRPLVDFPTNPIGAVVARSTAAALEKSAIGREVALMFEEGDPRRPIVIGLIQHAEAGEMLSPENKKSEKQRPLEAEVDGERVTLTAKKEIVLRCGKASIVLTRAGKVLIRGAYLLSRSSGVNRIKGGSIQLN